jgi:hypothetical protein
VDFLESPLLIFEVQTLGIDRLEPVGAEQRCDLALVVDTAPEHHGSRLRNSRLPAGSANHPYIARTAV